MSTRHRSHENRHPDAHPLARFAVPNATRRVDLVVGNCPRSINRGWYRQVSESRSVLSQPEGGPGTTHRTDEHAARMGQKRELTIEVKFTEADKECLARLVKELQKVGAEGSKVRAVPDRKRPHRNVPP